MDETFWKSLLSPVVPDEVTAAFDARLNAQRMLMSTRTGQVQRLELWKQQQGTAAAVPRIDDLVEVKRMDGQWVRVN